MDSKRTQALKLSEELLGDIELKRLEPSEIIRKASRLARLTDDSKAMVWLYYEVAGYPQGTEGLDKFAWESAKRSNRVYLKDGKEYARTSGIGQIQATIDASTLELSNSTSDNIYRKSALSNQIVTSRGELDRLIGSVHIYVMGKYQELRFGNAVETVFESIRAQVDANISQLVPQALPILTTALENASGDNPIQWSNGAKACRDLIKAAADALRPPGEDKKGRSMNDGAYINRLVDWIETNLESSTLKDMVVSDLEDLGKRLDALNDGGHKGAHTQAKLSKAEATRYIIGTYMLLGDILTLKSEQNDNSSAEPVQADASADSSSSVAMKKDEKKPRSVKKSGTKTRK